MQEGLICLIIHLVGDHDNLIILLTQIINNHKFSRGHTHDFNN